MSLVPNSGGPRPECSFGKKCYRKNPHHFQQHRHRHLAQLLADHPSLDLPDNITLAAGNKQDLKDQLKIYSDMEKLMEKRTEAEMSEAIKNINGKRSRSASPIQGNSKKKELVKGESTRNNGEEEEVKNQKKVSKIQEKLLAARPFNFFLTKVKSSPVTHKDMSSIFMTDILHPSLGQLSSSLQVNFMVEMDWLMMNYSVTGNDKKPLVILHGEDKTYDDLPNNVRTVRIKSRYPYGTHHTKLMVLVYSDGGVRVAVMTANLVGSDWENRTQGVWLSDLCPKLPPDGSDGESRTLFKSSLLRYLKFYEVSAVKQFTDAIASCDMSAVNVFFLASVPGAHREVDMARWGHRQVAKILRKHVSPSAGSWPVTVQCSSIGSLGPSPDSWMSRELGGSLSNYRQSTTSTPLVRLIYPSHDDVMASYDGPLGGGCLPYSRKTHDKQPWLENHMYRWSAAGSSRTRAMPHIKTYCRLSPDGGEAGYLLLTSCNLSKAAWGSVNKAGNSSLIMSYEAGVLFLPQFVTGTDVFSVTTFRDRVPGSASLPLHYDHPPQKYTANQQPWFYDFLRL